MSRAQRIHDAERVKNNRKRNTNVQPTEKSLGKALHTAANCSCWMCGNPRKFFSELTVQERRAMQDIE